MSPRPSNNNSAVALFRAIAWLIVLVGIPIALDMVGPWQGWIARVREQVLPYFTDREHAPGEPREGYDSLFSTPDRSDRSDRSDQSDRSDRPDRKDRSDKSGAPDTEDDSDDNEFTRNPEAQTPLQKRFETIYEEVLEVLPKPEPGATYTIRTRDGESLEGRLVEVRPGRLVLKTQYGKLGVPIDSLHPKEIKRFFPSREATNRALEILAFREQRKTANSETQPPDDAPETASAKPDSATRDPVNAETPNQKSSRSSNSSVKFDPTPEESDASIQPLVKAFADWLEVQHRRIGGKVANKVFAHQQNGAAILYLVVHPKFMDQDYEMRFQFAESLWQFWGFRAREFGAVSSPDDAYIVFLDSNRNPVGGSKPGNGSKVWMKGGDTVTAQR